MTRHFSYLLIGSVLMLTACNDGAPPASTAAADSASHAQGSFGYDVQFLRQHDDSVVLLQSGGARVAVSPKYQAKVFTSTARGAEGPSFGWINYKAFTAPQDAHMNAFGGENRFWLGPEGGVYSLYFKKGDSMVFDNWKTPPPIDTETWTVASHNSASVTMRKQMQLTNYAGTRLNVAVERTVKILPRDSIAARMGVSLNDSITPVGYQTVNRITNTGNEAWNETTGMPCIWILDMFNPSPQTVIVIPFNDAANAAGKIATTDYFGEIPADRIKYKNGVLFFKADGKSRGKLGLSPRRARPVAGSYDAQNHVLTITMFDTDSRGRYLNQEWSLGKPVFSGDAVNAYNDGPLADGSQMGPFYEIESVSPAAFLQPGASLLHHHAVFHFTGSESGLDSVARAVLTVSLQDIKQAF